MSIAIHITTHAPIEEVEELEGRIAAIVAELDEFRGPEPEEGEADERPPAGSWSIYGNDYSKPKPKLGIRVGGTAEGRK